MKQAGNIAHCLQELGYAVVPTKGTSMWPLLKEGESRVQIAARDGRQLKKGDVILYRRKDGALVLHRIMQIGEADTFLVCGDHQWKPDEPVKEEQILAVAQAFFRNGHYIDENTRWYRLYKKFWSGNLIVRRCCLAFLRLSGLEKRSLK